MIQVRNLSKSFEGNIAVDGLSFNLAAGKTLVLLGTSGCGKTTTLKMLNRLVEADAGEIFIDGQNIKEQNPSLLRRKIGYVIQSTGLFPHYTVEENIAIVPRLLDWDENRIQKRVNELLEMLGLDPAQFRNRKPEELSGGQKQRIGIARALAAEPPLILLDEPFGALDPITRDQIRSEFQNLEQLRDKTMVMVTHDVPEACELGDQICLMDKGKIIQSGTPAELIFQPVNVFVKEFFNPQRLQVELKVTKLHDLIKFLPNENSPTKEEISVSENDSLEFVLKIEKAESMIKILQKDGKSPLFTTQKNLLSAFYKFKSAMNE